MTIQSTELDHLAVQLESMIGKFGRAESDYARNAIYGLASPV
jgi:hypothetical protein